MEYYRAQKIGGGRKVLLGMEDDSIISLKNL